MSDRPLWEREGADWPNRESSQFVSAAGLRWHVQRMGGGPPLLMLHGTGAATHSWRDLAPRLARHFNLIAPDLPGHGFTEAPPAQRQTLPGMAAALGELMEVLGVRPVMAVGHSAGAAILARMTLDGRIAPRLLVSLNGALLPLHGVRGHLFAPAAKLFASFSLLPRLVARRAQDPALVRRLIHDTGSHLDPQGEALYGRLIRCPGHVAAALAMMAHWDLRPLVRDLPSLKTPLVLVACGRDRAVSPGEATRVHALLPSASRVSLPNLGHLAHEEQPQEVADLLVRLAIDADLLGSA